MLFFFPFSFIVLFLFFFLPLIHVHPQGRDKGEIKQMQAQFAVFVAGMALDKAPDSPDLRCGACDSRCAKCARGWVVGSTNSSPQPLSLNELVLISVVCEFGVTEPPLHLCPSLFRLGDLRTSSPRVAARRRSVR